MAFCISKKSALDVRSENPNLLEFFLSLPPGHEFHIGRRVLLFFFLKKKKQGNEAARQKFRNNSPFLFFSPYTIPRYFPQRQRKNFHPQAQRKTFFGICSFSSLHGGECQSQQQNRPLKPQSPHPPFQAPFVRRKTDRYVQPQKRSLIRNFCSEPRKRQPKSRSQYPNKTWNQRGSIKSFFPFSFSNSMFF